MQRFDLRHKKADFYDDMLNKMNNEVAADEVAIFLFEIGDFTECHGFDDHWKFNESTRVMVEVSHN